jgi:hypothetical protein
VSDEDALDSVEVPAAVVCARCGQPDCPGCEPLDETTLPSGVISIVPWERPGQSAWTRLWSTARASTRAAPQFFQSLPPGDHAPGVLFAVVSELCAVASWALLLAGVLAIPFSGFWLQLLMDPNGQMLLLRVVLVGTIGFTAVLVTGHVVYGLALDAGARRHGGRSHRSQAMRFGLYSTGWDLLTSPLGFVVSLIAEGPRAAFALVPLSVDAPGLAATAFLRGVYKIEGPAASRVRRIGAVIAIASSVFTAFLVLALLIAAVVL